MVYKSSENKSEVPVPSGKEQIWLQVSGPSVPTYGYKEVGKIISFG